MSQNPDEFILYSFRRCPYAMRVRIVLAIKKIKYTVIEERLGDWTDFLLKHVENPKVPVLVHAGRIILESNVINEYLEKVQSEPELIPFNRVCAEEMKKWWVWCEEELKPFIDVYKYESKSEEWFKGKSEVERQLEYLQLSLKRKHFLIGGRITLADIAIIPFVRQIQRIRRDPVNFRHFPKVKVWADQVLGQPYFNAEVMRKYSFAKHLPSASVMS